MDVLALQEEIDEISVMLYQNKEQDGIERISRFLGSLKDLTEQLFGMPAFRQTQAYGHVAGVYQELYRTYQHKDVLGMADCLQEYALLLAEIESIEG